MRNLILFMFVASACVSNAIAQSHAYSSTGQGPGCTGTSSNWPNNTYPCDPELSTGGVQYLPDDQITLAYTAYYTDAQGIHPINGLQVYLYCYTTQNSGYHSHDNGFFTNRPQPIYMSGGNAGFSSSAPCLSGIPAVTGTAGLGTAAWVFQLPGFSGWYSFYVGQTTWTDFNGQPQYIGEKGLNYYARYQVYEGPNAGTLTPYPDNTSINFPQLYYIDQNHQGQSSRFLMPPIVNQVTNASTTYRSDLLNILNIVPSQNYYVNVFRGSLFDGGVADNYFDAGPGYHSNWTTPTKEEHTHGVELDVQNPSVNANPSFALPDAWVVMLSDFSRQGCGVGIYAPGGTSSLGLDGAIAYWSQQSYLHLTCASAYQPRSTGHGQ